jgi:LPS O-antigen subunit length determinant protein (WzzB/FepE family)
MEEYEVDLRDYLRVLWQGKWIVLATLVVAVGVAAVVSFRAPDVYRAQASLTIQSPAISGFQLLPARDGEENVSQSDLISDLLSPTLVIEWVKDPAVLAAALADSEPSPGWVASHLQVHTKEELLELSLEGALPPETLRRALAGVVAAVQARGAEELKAALEAALAGIASHRERLARQLAAWEEELTRMKARAAAQRDQLLARISQLSQGAGPLDVPPGTEADLASYQLQRELDLLYSRLEAVELELDRLERLGATALPGVGEAYVELVGELAALEAQEAAVASLAQDPPSPVRVVRAPWASEFPVAPNRKMNLAVAGVLGLFCGVLLAFLWHWLKEPGVGAGESGAGGPPGG